MKMERNTKKSNHNGVFYPSKQRKGEGWSRQLNQNLWFVFLFKSFLESVLWCYVPVKGFVVHLVQPSLPARRHPPLRCSPLLVSQLSLRSFVAEDLHLRPESQQHRNNSNFVVIHLAVPSVGRSVHDVGTRIVEGVDLDVQRKPLHALLGAEVRGEALHGQVHLRWRFQRVPVDRTEGTEFY